MISHNKSIEQNYLINYAALYGYINNLKREGGSADQVERFEELERKMNKNHVTKIQCRKMLCHEYATHLTLKKAFFWKDYKDPHFWCEKHYKTERNKSFSVSGTVSFKYATYFMSKIARETFCTAIRRAFSIKVLGKKVAKNFFEQMSIE